VSDKPNKPRSKSDRERAAKMRSAYTNPYRTTSAAERRIAQQRIEERELAKTEEGRAKLRDQKRQRRADEIEETPQNVIEEALRHPTKFVTEGELREQYNHVIVDIRSMAVLAAGLIVVLFVLAFVLPR